MYIVCAAAAPHSFAGLIFFSGVFELVLALV